MDDHDHAAAINLAHSGQIGTFVEMDDESNAPTLKDIADAAGVSVASVSKVLNNRGGVGDDSRRKILDHAERLGYQVRAARSLIRAGVESTVLVMPA